MSPKEKTEALRIVSQVEERGILILKIAGFIYGSNINLFNRQIVKQIEKGYRKIILDCSELKYINSSALGILLDMHQVANKTGGRVYTLDRIK